MPFVQRVVAPVHLSRAKLHDERGAPTVRDRELDAVTNCALSNALRQMASVAALADEVFRELRHQLTDVAHRSAGLKLRVQALGRSVDRADPRAVTVPESDLTAFSLRTEHFKSEQTETRNLLSAANRPAWVKRLYEQAGVPSRVYANRSHEHRLSRRKRSLDDSCLPNNNDIELRKPASVCNLRPWTSEEVLGDITVAPDCSSRIPRDPSPVLEDQVDHKLPSPEEQQQVIAHKFPPEIVEVDISGRSFNRMSALRRSLQNVEYETSVRRRKSRRPRGKRRNTIAGTDQKELEAVIGSLSDSNKDSDDVVSSSTTVVTNEKRSNLNLLKDWGRMRIKQFKNMESSSSASVKLRDKGKIGLARRKWDKEEPVHSSSGNWSASSESGQSTSTSHVPRSSVSSCSGSTKPTYHGGGSVTSDEGETGSTYSCDTEGYYTSFHVDSGLKTLREEEPSPASQQQQQQPQPMSALHSTSALTPCSFQQSSSAESEYDVFGRGSTSTTASSAGTVCTSLLVSPPNVPERSGSKLSADACAGGSLPDRGLRGSPKDAAAAAVYDRSKTAPSRLTKENVTRYKQEGLMVDVQPRTSVAQCGDSPDSGHNTCSSPVDSSTNPSVDLEMSECSDLEGVDRVERLRVKTTINTSRIPSMCVITPPISDDEVHCGLKTLRASEPADDYGEYVTLARVAPEQAVAELPLPPPPPSPSPSPEHCAGFVHMNELPAGSLDRKKASGARVTLNAEGKVIYTSDSLKRRKKTHTTNTFEPGPFVSASVPLPVNKTNVVMTSQVIPRSPLNVRPVTKQNAFSSAQRVVAPKNLLSEQNPPSSRPAATNHHQQQQQQQQQKQQLEQLKPLVPVPLTCSPGLRRSARTAFPAGGAVNRPQPACRVVLPDGGRYPAGDAGKPVSPLISPTRRSLSPKEVVKGAYVRMQDPTECLETSLDEIKSVVKRSDSYRQANAGSPRPACKSPSSMLMALQKSHAQGTPSCSPAANSYGKRDDVSASTPVKDDRSAGRIDMSSSNISPIHVHGHRHRSPGPADQSQHHRWTPPAAVPPQSRRGPSSTTASTTAAMRPATSGRSAMDLYAAIHESKKRLMGGQQQQPAAAAARTPAGPAPERQRPRSPERQSNRYGRPRGDDRSARYDFKRLLLQTNMAGGRRAQQSAVVRLQQPPRPSLRAPAAAGRRGASWKSDVLSATIPEDRREEEDGSGCYAVVPESSALVNRTLKSFAAAASATLETAL